MKKRIALIILSIIAGLLIIAGIYFGPQIFNLYENWQEPLGESLGLPTGTSTESLSSTTPTSQPLCGGPSVMTILAIGSDRGGDYLYGLADVIRVVRVDFVNPKVTVVDIPRDLWIEIPDISEHYGIDHGKLNQAYLYGNPGMGYYDGPGNGPGLLARTLAHNFGLRVDHYFAVNMSTFVRAVDALGGIDVYLPEDVDGRPLNEGDKDMGYFTAGYHHFDGDQALRFSRIRKKYSTFKRADNQSLVLCALREKVVSPSVITKIPQLIAAFEDSIQTDLSLAQFSQLACLGSQMPRENIILGGLSEEQLTASNIYDPYLKNTTFVWEYDADQIRDLFAQFMDGTWPLPDPDSEMSCPEPTQP